MSLVYQNKSWSYKNNIQYASSGTTIISADTKLVYCDTTTGPCEINLLLLSNYWDTEYKLFVHDYGTDGTDGISSVNPITIYVNNPNERINGLTFFTLSKNRGSVLIRPVDKTNWIAQATDLSDTKKVTYSELVELIGLSGLTEGSYYLITDFQTIYDQPDFYPINSNYSNHAKTPLTKTGDTEPLLVFAISSDNISVDAYQPKYPKDKIKYDWTWSSTEVNGEPAKGRITERIDEYNNRTDYDHRNVLFKRYRTYYINEKLSGYVSSYNSSTGSLVGVGTNFTALTPNDIILMSQVVSGQYILFGVKIQSITDNNNLTTYIDPSLPLINFLSEEIDIFSITSSSDFFNHKEYYIGQSNDGDYEEKTTFQLDGDTKDNYIGNYSIFGEHFILSNNVFGYETYSNTIGDRCVNNTTGDQFYRNRILTEFYNNTLLSWFFQNNEIGNGFNNNILYGDFYNNKILNGFNRNVIFYLNNNYTYFYRNIINSSFNSNVINLEFFGNNIDFGFASNLIGTYESTPFRFIDNTIGKYFILNTINGDFKLNTIKNHFRKNIIDGEFNENDIGNYFGGGVFTGEPLYNNIGFEFTNNVIGDYFGSNGYGNNIGDSFTYNKIGNNFQQNVIGADFSNNLINDKFKNNLIGSFYMSNTIGNDFDSNQIGNIFINNKIGNKFKDNTICPSLDAYFGYIVQGEFIYDYGNVIGDDFKDNIINQYFYNNSIGNYFSSNNIGSGFTENYFSSNDGGGGNNIGNDFKKNKIFGGLKNNTIGNGFTQNYIKTFIDSQNFSASTFVYGNYNCEIFSNFTGGTRLSYYDSSDILTITGVTS